MRLPIYQEIFLTDDNAQHWLPSIEAVDNTKTPYLIHLNASANSNLKIVRLLEEYIYKNSISPFYPYPVYLVGQLENYKGSFKIYLTKNNVPLFFKKFARNLNSKEQTILSKNLMLAQKVANFNHQEYQAQIKRFTTQHKKMYLEVFEGEFLEKLIKKMRGFVERR